MEKIKRNIMINKAGGTASKGGLTYRVSLPAEVIRMLGVTPEDREVALEWDENENCLKIYKNNDKKA